MVAISGRSGYPEAEEVRIDLLCLLEYPKTSKLLTMSAVL